MGRQTVLAGAVGAFCFGDFAFGNELREQVADAREASLESTGDFFGGEAPTILEECLDSAFEALDRRGFGRAFGHKLVVEHARRMQDQSRCGRGMASATNERYAVASVFVGGSCQEEVARAGGKNLGAIGEPLRLMTARGRLGEVVQEEDGGVKG